MTPEGVNHVVIFAVPRKTTVGRGFRGIHFRIKGGKKEVLEDSGVVGGGGWGSVVKEVADVFFREELFVDEGTAVGEATLF